MSAAEKATVEDVLDVLDRADGKTIDEAIRIIDARKKKR